MPVAMKIPTFNRTHSPPPTTVSPYPGRKIHFQTKDTNQKQKYDVKLEKLIKLQLMKYTRQRRLVSKGGLHVELDARGDILATQDDGSAFGVFQIISICSDMIAFWGREAQVYLAVNEHGVMYAAEQEGRDCVFIERFTHDFFNTYISYHSAFQNKPQYLTVKNTGHVTMTPAKSTVSEETLFTWRIPKTDESDTDMYATL